MTTIIAMRLERKAEAIPILGYYGIAGAIVTRLPELLNRMRRRCAWNETEQPLQPGPVNRIGMRDDSQLHRPVDDPVLAT
jgi:hypothetical protein